MVDLLVVGWMGLLSILPISPVASPWMGDEGKEAGRQLSKPVRVGGVDFEVAAEAIWERPTEVYGTFKPEIELRIHNRTDRDLTLDLGGALHLSLKAAEGPELIDGPIAKRHFPKPVKVAAGKSESVTLPLQFVHTRIRRVCLGVRSDAVGTNWVTGDVPPGKYRLQLSLESSDQRDDVWLGKMRTETLEIEVQNAR